MNKQQEYDAFAAQFLSVLREERTKPPKAPLRARWLAPAIVVLGFILVGVPAAVSDSHPSPGRPAVVHVAP